MRGESCDGKVEGGSSQRMTSDACFARYWIMCVRTGCMTNSSRAALFWALRCCSMLDVEWVEKMGKDVDPQSPLKSLTGE